MRRTFGIARLPALMVGLAIGAVACDRPDSLSGAAPPARPAPLVTTVPADSAQVAPRSAASLALERHYARVQDDLRAQGLLRRDTGRAVPPPGAARLAETFLTLALYDEHTRQGDRLVASARETRLRRWEAPVRVAVRFGETVPQAQRAADARTVTAYVRRLASATGHPISLTQGPANFHVFVLNEDDRRAALPRLKAAMPELDAATLRAIGGLPRGTLCAVYIHADPATGALRRAVAVVRGEHPDLLRLSCLHEEIAQGLGLLNDSGAARPSIFNDDEEFALLTRQDERLLGMLYDARFRPGMTLSQARPVAYEIAGELAGGES